MNVRWREGVSAAQIKIASKRLGFSASKVSKLGWAQLTVKSSVSAGTLARTLHDARLTTEAKPVVRVKALDMTPNDTLFSSQWALKNTGQDGGTPGADISATEAWAQTKGSHDVIVAIVDEGVNWAHPDLKNNMWLNTAEVPGNGVDDDNDGYVDDVRGWDFFNQDNTVYDVADGDLHGTHVAGIIGAEGDNAMGVSGVNQHVRMMPLKFLGQGGWGDDFGAAEAITYAVDHGATVINCSWGGGASDVIKDAVDYAAAHGVIMAVAAGNDGWNNDDPEGASYPASYDTTNIVAVAASDRNDKLAEWSSYGEDSVDLAAPGVDVTSTLAPQQAGFFTDAMVYKSVYLPVQAEIMEPASARDALITGAVEQMGETSDTPILVVDDSAAKVTSETQGWRLKIYTDALGAAGYSDVSTWVTDEKGTPTQAAMNGKTVVWFTGKDTAGWYDDPCLTDIEQKAIADQLDNGGHVALISGKAATDLQYFGYMSEDLDLISQYFGAQSIDYETWAHDFEGRSGSSLAGVKCSIPSSYTLDPNNERLWPTASDQVYLSEEGNGTTSIMYSGSYAPLSGTSMATPHVTGAIALLKAKYPSSSPDELVARVLNTVDRKSAFAGKTATGGRLNLAAAMSSYPGRVSITDPKKGDSLHSGTTSTLKWKPAVAGSPDATFTAQIGMPYTAFAAGFEDGTLGSFTEPTMSASPWSASTEATSVHSGTYGAKSGALPAMTPAPELGEGWYHVGISAMQTTITVPEGGADLTYNWRMPESDGWDTAGWFIVDGSDSAMLDTSALDDPKLWTKNTTHLLAGEHVIAFAAANYTKIPSDIRLSIDDITLTAHSFTDIGSAGAGATSLDFTVPATATADAWLRVQSHLNGVDSPWAVTKGVKIVTDALAPSAPASLHLTPDLDGNVGITWVNPADPDFDHVTVLAGTERPITSRDDTSASVAYEGTGTVASYGPVKNGKHVYVSAWAVDMSGNWSPAVSQQTTATDVTGPAPVRSLRVVQPMPGLPVVVWSGGNADGDTVTVLRSYTSTPTVHDPDAASILAAPGMAMDWDTDPDATQAFYTVYVTDASGNVSAPRSTRAILNPSGITGDVTISGLHVPATDEAVIDTTTASVTASVTNATEMRVSINDEMDPDADWVPFQSHFNVELLPIQGEQSVTVELRSGAGQMPTEFTVPVLVMLRAPLAPSPVTVESFNSGFKVRWDVPVDPTISYYLIETSLSEFGPWEIVAGADHEEMMGSAMYVAGRSPDGIRTVPFMPGVTRYFRATAYDLLDRAGAPSLAVTGVADVGVQRFVGIDRFGTAAAASAAQIETGSPDGFLGDTVVIAPAGDYMQALAANSLAGRYGASVLLAGSTLPSATITEIQRLGVHKAKVVGTNAAIWPNVDTALKGLGLEVERLGGSDGYAVAAKVARRMSGGLIGSREAFVVNGSSKADMAALMPVAYTSGHPVIMVKTNSIPSAFKTMLAKTPLDSATLIGGTSVISTSVRKHLSKDAYKERIWGATAPITAAKFATWAVSNDYGSWENVSIANPSTWVQSLNIGATSRGGVVLLTSRTQLDATTASAIRRRALKIDKVSIFGGTGTVSTTVQSKIRSAMTIPYSLTIPDPRAPIDYPPDEGEY